MNKIRTQREASNNKGRENYSKESEIRYTEAGTKSPYQLSSSHKGHPVLIFQAKETQLIPLNTQTFSSMRAQE